MRSGTVVVLLVLIVLVAVGLVLWMGADGSPRGASRPVVGGQGPERDEPTLPTTEGAATERLDSPTMPEASPDETADPAAEGGVARLLGRVVLGTVGTPVAGVEVQAATEPGLPEEAWLDEGRLVTDEDGRFVLALAVPGPVTLSRLVVGGGPETYAHDVAPDLALRPGETATLEVPVPPTSTLSGTVVTRDGLGVAQAQVQGWRRRAWQRDIEAGSEPDRRVTADGTGRFVLRGVGPNFVLSARAPGLAPFERLHGLAPAGATVDALTLVLAPTSPLAVRVVGPGGRPVAGAHLVVEVGALPTSRRVTDTPEVFRLGAEPQRGTTDTLGQLVLERTVEVRYTVVVTHDDHASWTGHHTPSDGELLVELTAGGVLVGHVVSSDGEPVADASVLLTPGLFGDGSRRRETATDATGGFAFDRLWAEDDAILAVRATGFAVAVVHPLDLTAEQHAPLEVVIEPERRLAGVVVDAEGQPVAEAGVSIVGDRVLDSGEGAMTPLPTWESRWGLHHTSTDAEGRFRFGHLYDGLFALQATHPGDRAVTAGVEVASGNEDLRLVLDPEATSGVTLLGTVKDGTTGMPVTRFQVTPMIPQGQGGLVGNGRSFEHAAGAWRITGLEPGDMQVTAAAPGYAPWGADLQRYDEGRHRIDIELLPDRTLHLRVLDDEREPVSARLAFLDAAGSQLMVASGPGARTSLLSTGENGEAIARELPASFVTVVVKAGWFGREHRFDFDLRSAPRGVQELILGEVPELNLAVVVFGSTEPRQLAVDPSNVEPDAAALTELIDSGAAWPLAVAGTVSARDASGRTVGQAALAPGGGSLGVPLSLPSGRQLTAAILEVPAAALTLEITAEGHRPAIVDWVPHRQADAPEAAFVFLQRE